MQQRYLRAYDSLQCFLTPSILLSNVFISTRPLIAPSLKTSQYPKFGLHRVFTATIAVSAGNKHTEATRNPNDRGLAAQESNFDDAVAPEKEKQTRAPWHREGSNVPPVKRQRSAGAMTKGKRFLSAQLETY